MTVRLAHLMIPMSLLSRLARAAHAIRRRSGVVGAFLGARCRAGKWAFDEPVLSVHVKRKRAPRSLSEAEFVPAVIEGISTDILAVGEPRVHGLSCDDPVRGNRGRVSTISAIARAGARRFALASGHAVLPYVGTRIERRTADDGTIAVDFVDDDSVLLGALRRGAFGEGRPYDFAAVEFSPTAHYDDTHRATLARTPFRTRADPPMNGEPVGCWSAAWNRSRWISGRVIGNSLTDIELRLPDGSMTTYSRVLSVASDSGNLFSQQGDSGTLVIDRDRLVVGTVLGGNGGTSYVLLARYLRTPLGTLFPHFFMEA